MNTLPELDQRFTQRQDMEKVDVGKYIVIDPEICHGQMTFKGTRVPVDTVLTFLGKG